MNVDLKTLIRIQTVDLEIHGLCETTEAFPAKSQALDDKLSAAKSAVSDARNKIQEGQSKRKNLEGQVSDIQEKISKYKEQLMSVKTNVEYKAMVGEIGYAETSIGAVEDEILSLMVESETLEETLTLAQERLLTDEKSVQEARVRLEEHNAADVAALNSYVAERKVLAEKVSKVVFDRYERIRQARGGVALSKAIDETCILCNVRMRPQKFQEVRKNDQIINCDSCDRILFNPENLDHPCEIV